MLWLCAAACCGAALLVTAHSNDDPPGTDEPTTAAIAAAAQSEHCDTGLASLAPVLGETMDSVYQINYAIADQATSPEDLVRGSRVALSKIAGLWRDLGHGRSELVQTLVNDIGDAWELGTAIGLNNPEGSKRNLLAIASAYDDLAHALVDCDLWADQVERLRTESSNLNQFAAAMP